MDIKIKVLFLIIVLICIIVPLIIKRRRKRISNTQLYTQKNDDLRTLNDAVDAARQMLSNLQQQVNSQQAKLNALNSSYDTLNKQFLAQQASNQEYIANEQQFITMQLDNWRASEKDRIANEIEQYRASQTQRTQLEYEEYVETIDQLCDDYHNQLIAIQLELDNYKQKRQQINEEILRQRAINEQQDFYRINLTDAIVEDISVINSIREKLHKREYLDKMVYDNYVSKAVKETTKRVLKGRDPSGIYKITNIQTGEIYIGKSTGVATRWMNHIKSACGLEGVADSRFQRALKKYGIENWTFELLEEVPKDKLTEREKYYITFYESNKYGYNDRVG